MLVDLAWLLGVLTLALLSPGPDFLLVVKNSVGGTRPRALATAVGIAAGLAGHMLVISLGLAATPAGVLRAVQLVGVVFLGYVGLRALLARVPDGMPAVTQATSARSGFVEGLLCNVTNPKAFVFFVSLFAQVVPAGSSVGWRVLVPVVVVGHGLVLWCGVAFALQAPLVARTLGRAQHWLPRIFGGALVLVALAVLVEAWGAERVASSEWRVVRSGHSGHERLGSGDRRLEAESGSRSRGVGSSTRPTLGGHLSPDS